MSRRRIKPRKQSARPKRCAHCRKNPALQAGVRLARIEDIPDGSFVQIPDPICAECLERISDELWQLSGE